MKGDCSSPSVHINYNMWPYLGKPGIWDPRAICAMRVFSTTVAIPGKSRANRQLIWFLIQLRVEWSLFGEKWSNRSRDINVFCDRGMAKKFCPFLVVIVVQLVENFTLVFEPYLGNAAELRDGFCAKMISWIWRLQPHPHWLAMIDVYFSDIWRLAFWPYSFMLDVLLAGTSTTFCNIFLTIPRTIWH